MEASSPSLATCALRPSIIIGAGDTTTIPAIHSCIAKGETFFRIGSGDNLCEFTYVDNVADAHVLAAENLLSPSPTAAGEAFFITNGQPVAFRDFCLAVWAEFGHVPAFEIQVPETLASFVGYVAEWASWVTGRPVTLSRGSVKDYCGVRYANISKAERMLGYRPRVDLAEGLRRSCQVKVPLPSLLQWYQGSARDTGLQGETLQVSKAPYHANSGMIYMASYSALASSSRRGGSRLWSSVSLYFPRPREGSQTKRVRR